MAQTITVQADLEKDWMKAPMKPEGILEYIEDEGLDMAFATACMNNSRGYGYMPLLIRCVEKEGIPHVEAYGTDICFPADGELLMEKYFTRTEKTGKWIPAFLVNEGDACSLIIERGIRPYEDPETPDIIFPDEDEVKLGAISSLGLCNVKTLMEFLFEGATEFAQWEKENGMDEGFEDEGLVNWMLTNGINTDEGGGDFL